MKSLCGGYLADYPLFPLLGGYLPDFTTEVGLGRLAELALLTLGNVQGNHMVSYKKDVHSNAC